ncbi:MAG: MFS transporter [Rhodanobacteraceae bacterium]
MHLRAKERVAGRKQGLFYGWWVAATAALGLFLSAGSIVVLSFGVFFKPLSQDFHAGRTAISLAFSLNSLIAAITIPLIGRLIDRFGARRVILIGTALFTMVLLSSEFVGSHIASLYIFFAVLGAVNGTTSPVPYGVVVSRWFDKRRGLALGLMAIGLGLGAILMPLFAQRLIAMFGWRGAYAIFGGAAALLTLPLVGAFLLESPAQKGLRPDGTPFNEKQQPTQMDQQGLSWRDTWHQPTFWLLIGAFSLAAAGLLGCIVHLPTIVADRGGSAQNAAVASSVIGIALLIGRFGAGYLLDRFFAPRLAMIFFGGAALGFTLLLAGSSGILALAAAFLLGLGMGSEVDIMAFLMSRYFGLRSLGTAFGFGFGSYILAGAVGALIMGAGFDTTHSYALPLEGFLFAMLVAIVVMARLGPYRYAPQS